MKSIHICLAMLGLLLAAQTTATAAFVATTPQYEVLGIPGGTLTVGNIQFSNFQLNITGNVPSTPTSFLVQAGTDGTNFGLRFSPQNFIALADQFINASLSFQITALPPSLLPQLSGVDMTLTGVSTIGSGIVTIGESVGVSASLLQPPVANLSVVAMQGISPAFLHDSATFAPLTTAYIRKDILLSGGSSLGDPGFGVAHLSEFFQIYQVVPEPSLLGLGIVGSFVSCWVIRRRKS